MKKYLDILQHSDSLRDTIYFIVFVTLGASVKIIKQKQKDGKKVSLKWFLAEFILSFFVALIVYAVFDQFLNLNRLFTLTMCALGGSFSTIFHEKLEALIGFLFELAKKKITHLIG